MTWARIDDQFPNHPKIVAVGPLAGWLHLAAICYCSSQLTDGFVPAGMVKRLADVPDADALVDALVTHGLWDSTDAGYIIHDYLEYNPPADRVKEKRALAAERQARWAESKKKQGPKLLPNASTDALPNASANAAPSHPLITPTEGADAPAPEKPKKIPGVNLAPLYAAFTAAGLPRPIIPKQDHKAAGDLLQQVGPDAIVGCWIDIGNGVWPPNDKLQWMKNNRSIGTIAPRINNWLDFKQGRNGTAKAGKVCKDWED